MMPNNYWRILWICRVVANSFIRYIRQLLCKYETMSLRLVVISLLPPCRSDYIPYIPLWLSFTPFEEHQRLDSLSDPYRYSHIKLNYFLGPQHIFLSLYLYFLKSNQQGLTFKVISLLKFLCACTYVKR